ncbi:MAG: hypothetical protein RI917_545 [Actinomycetota bacterium]
MGRRLGLVAAAKQESETHWPKATTDQKTSLEAHLFEFFRVLLPIGGNFDLQREKNLLA